jgi:hypothetical protein
MAYMSKMIKLAHKFYVSGGSGDERNLNSEFDSGFTFFMRYYLQITLNSSVLYTLCLSFKRYLIN